MHLAKIEFCNLVSNLKQNVTLTENRGEKLEPVRILLQKKKKEKYIIT